MHKCVFLMFPPTCYCRSPFKWPPEPALLLKFLWELEHQLPRKCLSGFSLLIWPPSANQLSCSILCTSLSLGAALSQFQCYEFWSESKLKPGLSPGAQDASLLVATDPLGATRPHNHWGHSLLQPSLRTGPVWAWLSHPLADGSPWAIRPADSEQSGAPDTSDLSADHSLTTHPASHPPCDSHASSHLPVDVPSNGPLTSCSRSLRLWSQQTRDMSFFLLIWACGCPM